MDDNKPEGTANFDWQTDDDAIFSSMVSAAWRTRRRRWITFLVALLIIVALVTYWQFNRRVESRQVAAEEDVLIAFRLWQEAITRTDPEIMSVLLGSNDAEWASTQQKLLESGAFLDRTSMGLQLPDTDGQFVVEDPQVVLSPDWRSAEVSFDQLYRPSDGASPSNEAHLQQSVTFNFEGAHWVLGRPKEEYWGEWVIGEGSLLSLVYRQRDETLVERFGEDLEKELQSACANMLKVTSCPETTHVTLKMESDPSVMFRMVDRHTPAFEGHTFVLPTPTLVGLPADDEAYQALYQGYADRIVSTFESNLTSPIPVPDQKVQLLCFSEYGSSPRLHRYDPVLDSWSIELPDRSFQVLNPTHDDEGLILQEYLPGETADRLRIVYWRGGSDKLLLDEVASSGIFYRTGWVVSPAERSLLLLGYGANSELTRFNRIDMNLCGAGGCDVVELAGYPVSSRDGQQTLVWHEGSLNRVAGDGRVGGEVIAPLGHGFSPFWIDDKQYGFVRHVSRDSKLVAEIVVAKVDKDQPVTLLDSEDLGEMLGDTTGQSIFINYVAVRPGDPGTLIVAGRRYEGDQSRFYVYSARLDGVENDPDGEIELEELKLLFELDSLPFGYPSLVASTGYSPFVLSDDGRWLSVSGLVDVDEGPWNLYVHSIDGEETTIYSTRYPASTSRYPYYDWSADGQWLILVDENFLRLVAPAYEYERLITHDLKACSQVAWVN